MNSVSKEILLLADRCVKCGLCLPQCPTYQLTANENESPRGRIALIQGWLGGDLSPSKKLTQHIDRCLLCRRCERICPSKVSYSKIIDQSKALLVENRSPFSKVISHYSLKILLNKTLSNSLFSSLRFLQKIGLIFLIKQSNILRIFNLQRLLSYLPKLDKAVKTKTIYPTQHHIGNVALFTGCLSKQLDPKTVRASIKLLNLAGYSVHVPEQQTCCGALHLHEGKLKQASELANTNTTAFNQLNDVTIVSLVNGCTLQLREYDQLNITNNFTHPVKDIIEFLSEVKWPEKVLFKPLDKAVSLQIPCSLQNSLQAENKLISLIKNIPNISIETTYNKCCGAAGSYFLKQPALSDKLKNNAIQQLLQSDPKYIISSNLGCALQLSSILVKGKTSIIHPIELLEKQLV